MSDNLMDDIARILASPIPRRRAAKLIAGGFAGAALAFFGGRDAAAADCKTNEIRCGKNCCPAGHVCLPGNKCCPFGQVCSGTCCKPGYVCVNNVCRPKPASQSEE